ncbi:hypothetical protein ATANTOWER_012957 [Ataeniobius toweri]|uniref:Uncharacterized protein n=1 Tax=Ataeniobius toweri TaxID=208326 RepID=A0ABU7AUH1_9TELE|nr:hypothetical protein [Ataeniobius toweri]
MQQMSFSHSFSWKNFSCIHRCSDTLAKRCNSQSRSPSETHRCLSAELHQKLLRSKVGEAKGHRCIL